MGYLSGWGFVMLLCMGVGLVLWGLSFRFVVQCLGKWWIFDIGLLNRGFGVWCSGCSGGQKGVDWEFITKDV